MHRRRGTGTTAIVWVIVGSPGCAYRTGASDSAAPRAGPGVTRSPLRVGASTLCAVLTQRNLSLRLEGHQAHGTPPPGAISRTISPHYRRAGCFVGRTRSHPGVPTPASSPVRRLPAGRVRIAYSVVYDLRGGQISALRIYFPMSLLLEQLTN